MADNIEHFGFHQIRQILIARLVDWLVYTQPGQLDGLLCAQPVKLNPHILPRNLMVGNIHVNLVWKAHKPLSALDRIGDGFALCIVAIQNAGAGNTVVKQIVVSRCGAK